ncbi:MAG TPA: hypothetical protein PKU94_03685 [Candidatus Hydrothermia bacterium]|nr:hypothetical protein [Candidatus Hydrothermia bacterium]MDD5572639.1 hypothetical protein [Candidatus Hydrothermia bacterium]HOP32463.1 hypothetical protein [Candidatus Hydrothermia bacterium]
MKLKILGSESMGVRSYSTFIETYDLRIIIDPGCALGPKRFNLPPHKLEVVTLWNTWRNINKYLKKSNAAIISHYHYDHHHYRNAKFYEGKIVFVKNTLNLNLYQKKRAETFFKALGDSCKIIIADEKTFQFGNTSITFTMPVPHGFSGAGAEVIGVYIKDENSSLFYTSDISGILEHNMVDFLIKRRIDTMIFDGFPTYLLGSKVKKESLDESIYTLKILIRECKINTLVIDHHSARDKDWESYYEEIFSLNTLKFVGTSASIDGSRPQYLEARRRSLFFCE